MSCLLFAQQLYQIWFRLYLLRIYRAMSSWKFVKDARKVCVSVASHPSQCGTE